MGRPLESNNNKSKTNSCVLSPLIYCPSFYSIRIKIVEYIKEESPLCQEKKCTPVSLPVLGWEGKLHGLRNQTHILYFLNIHLRVSAFGCQIISDHRPITPGHIHQGLQGT
jgi:hypothetical protein